MSILTKPQVSQGVPAEFELNKVELEALIPNGNYMADSSNWEKIMLHYQSVDGSQQIVVPMDATLIIPKGKFLASEHSQNIFEIEFITILDFDGGKFIIKKDELISSEFKIDFGAKVLWTKDNPSNLLDYGESGLISNNYQGWNNGAIGQEITGDFEIRYNITILSPGPSSGDMMLGYSHSSIDMSQGLSAIGTSKIIYLDQGTSISTYSQGFVNSPSGYIASNKQISLIFSREGSTISYSVKNESNSVITSGIVENSYTGSVFPVAAIYGTGARVNSVSLTNVSPEALPLWDTFSSDIASDGNGELHRTGGSLSWTSGKATKSQAITGDFTLTGSAIRSDTNYPMMIGYSKVPFSTGEYTGEVSSAIYLNLTGTVLFGTGTAVEVTSGSSEINTEYSFSITRVGSTITCIFDGATLFTDNYSGSIYLGAAIRDPNGGIFVSTVLL